MAANIKIVDVSLIPNPVAAGASLKISVEIHKNICLLVVDDDGELIETEED